MFVRTMVLVVVLLGLTGCDKLNNVVSKLRSASPINSSPPAASQPAPPAPAAPAVYDPFGDAINLAKNAHTLSRGEIYMAGYAPDPATTTNEARIRNLMAQVKGDITILGWQAFRWDDDTFLVSYSYKHNGQDGATGWPFEVKLNEQIVRAVLGDPELEKKYGWATAK